MLGFYHIDFETYSEKGIDCGSYLYATHPSTRILLCAINTPSGKVVVWQNPSVEGSDASENEAVLDILRGATELDIFYAHNSQFEYDISDARMLLDMGVKPPKQDQWRCTAAMCRKAAIPHSLDKAAKFLNLAEKNPQGSRLIKIFSEPCEPKPYYTVAGEKLTHAEAWAAFAEYCRQDVVVEMQIHKKLKAYESKGWELEHFFFDARMNRRGLPINRGNVMHAVTLLNQANAKLELQFTELTNGLMPSQTKAFQTWMQAEGYPYDNLQAATVQSVLDSPPDGISQKALQALEIRSKLSFAAVKKLPTMLELSSEDGFARNQFMWWGAIRTGRHSARGIQPQNMKRPEAIFEKGHTDMIYSLIQNRCSLNDIEDFYGDAHRSIASCIRHFIHHPTKQLLDADFSNIEARCLVWLAGQHDTLQLYTEGVDMYCRMAKLIYGREITKKDKAERFIGKVAELACGYQGGLNAFLLMAKAYGVDVPEELAQKAIDAYRNANPEVVNMWRKVGEAAVAAVRSPDNDFTFRGITFRCTTKRGFPALLVKLLSGRVLTYPYPEVKKVIKKFPATKKRDAMEFEVNQLTFYGQLKNSVQWGRIETHGGKLTENISQAVSGDFLAHACISLEKKGFDVVAVIHDQCLALWDGSPTAREEFIKTMRERPSWALDFPLDATCDMTPYYTKD
jgi:DNA polymerase